MCLSRVTYTFRYYTRRMFSFPYSKIPYRISLFKSITQQFPLPRIDLALYHVVRTYRIALKKVKQFILFSNAIKMHQNRQLLTKGTEVRQSLIGPTCVSMSTCNFFSSPELLSILKSRFKYIYSRNLKRKYVWLPELLYELC